MVGINYTGTQITQWDFQNKETRTSPARLSFVLKVPLRNLRPSVIYSVPCGRIVQRAGGRNFPSHTAVYVNTTGIEFLAGDGIEFSGKGICSFKNHIRL